MDDIIRFAIQNQKLVSFIYEKYFRIVEPHSYGKTTKENTCLRAYQVDGESSNGIMGWKLFDLSKANNIELLETTFTNPREGYKRGDKQMTQIFSEL
jgi:hypothetical protein